MNTSITPASLYQRQISLIGQVAQSKIEKSRVLVIGAGGLGCPALLYLASAGVGEIAVVDADKVAATNLQRQILYQAQDVGRLKVDVVKENLEALAPFAHVQIFPYDIDAANAKRLLCDYEVILDCTDNLATKFLLHDTAWFQRKILIQAAVYQYEGQLQVFDFRTGFGPCLRCLWPQQPLDGATGTCAEVGVLGPVLGVIGSLQAMEALKIILGKENLKNGQTLFIDLMTLAFDLRHFQQKDQCLLCRNQEGGEVTKNWPINQEWDSQTNLEISLPVDLDQYIILDVRSEIESASCPLLQKLRGQSPIKIMSLAIDLIDEFSPLPGQKYLTICDKGVRSLYACRVLRKKGGDVYSLRRS